MNIQQALYMIEVGRGRVWVLRLALLVALLALAMLYAFGHFHGFSTPESFDTAQIARQIVRGQGYTTEVLRPAQIARWQELHPGQEFPAVFPEMNEAPAYPAVMSVVFQLSGVSFDVANDAIKNMRIYFPECIMIFFNQFCLLLTVLLIYVWGIRMFDERVGMLAAAVFVLSDLMWQFSLSGMSTTWVILILTVQGFCLTEALQAEEEERSSAVWGWVVAAAVALGLGILSRLSVAWVFPVQLLLLAGFFRARLVLVTVLVVSLLVAPWAWRNARVTGSVVGANLDLVRSGVYDYPGTTQPRSYTRWHEGSLLKTVLYKLVKGSKYYFEHYQQLTGASLAALLFLVSLLHPFRRWCAKIFRIYLLGSVLILSWGAMLLSADPDPLSFQNGLVLYLPGLILFGCAFFYVLLDRLDIELQLLKNLFVLFFGFLNAIPLLLTLAPPGEPPFKYPPYFPPLIKLTGSWLAPGETMVSDMPWATAWYGDRRSLWLPRTLEEYYSIHSFLRTQGLLLTPVTGDLKLSSDIDQGEFKSWSSIIRRQGLPPLFPLGAYIVLPPNNGYFFLSDRERWK